MKALCYHGRKDVRVDTVDDPKIQDPRDAIIKITSTAICGSDLHLYHGYMPGMEVGDVIGHEPMGEVIEVGGAVKPDEQVLFLSDIFPTGYMAAENAQIKKGDTVAVWGCGPAAQFAIQSAWMLGAGRVIAIDRVTERLAMAKTHDP